MANCCRNPERNFTLSIAITALNCVPLLVNSSFSTLLPKLQLAWDSTSYGALKTCPRYYQYAIIEGRVYPGESPHLKFGIVFHSATEVYEKSRAEGQNHNSALVLALRHAIIETWDFSTNRPWTSTEPTKTRETLLRSIIWYLDTFQNDSLKTLILSDGKAAVELSFRFSINDLTENGFRASTGEEYILCGHLDKCVEFNEDLWIVDKKTTKAYLNTSYFANYSPDNQISLYSVAGRIIFNREIAGIIIDAIQVRVTGTRFRRQPIPRSTAQLEEWLTDLQFYLRMAEIYATINYWPQNDRSCGLYGGCKFRPVCSSEPAARPDLLDALYTTRIWDPLVPR